MRTFKLWNSTFTDSFDLSSKTCFATDPAGLGTVRSLNVKESDRKPFSAHNRPIFEPIRLTVLFNLEGDAYHNYHSLLSFLGKRGNTSLIFDYYDGSRRRFCDVLLSQAPKSEIKNDRMMRETLVFERFNYWYAPERYIQSLGAPPDNVAFPLEFPIGFTSTVFESNIIISNDFFESTPIDINIVGSISNPLEITITDTGTGELVDSLMYIAPVPLGTEVRIYSEEKKATIIAPGVSGNAYGVLSKLHSSFLYLKPGEFNITSNLAETDTGYIVLSFKRYFFD